MNQATLNGALPPQMEPSDDFKRGYGQCAMQMGGQLEQQNREFGSLLTVLVRQLGRELPEGVREVRVARSAFMTMPPGTALERSESTDGEAIVFRMLPPEIAARKSEQA